MIPIEVVEIQTEQNPAAMQTNFLLGSLSMTPSAKMVLKRLPYDLVCRHAINEHGLITKKERAANELGMITCGPIKSRYRADPTAPKSKHVVIETDETWSNTLIRLE